MFNQDQLMEDVDSKKRTRDISTHYPNEPIIIIEDDDLIQVSPKLKKVKQNTFELKLEENNAILPSEIKLTIELVPKTCWFDNVRTNMSPYYWKKLSKASLESANHQCEVCGSPPETSRKLECHEKWDFDGSSKIQKLLGLITLCRSCHETKHIGLADKHGRLSIVTAHLALVNGWILSQAEKYIDEAFSIWWERSQHQWELDISWVEMQAIPLKNRNNNEMKTPTNELIKAMGAKNFDEIKSLVTEVSEVELHRLIYHEENKRKLNPIHEAILSNDKDFLEKLLNIPQLQLYINKADKFGETPLFCAVKNQRLEFAKLLLARGADVLVENSHKKTVLHHAVNNKDFACVSLLFQYDVDKSCHTYDSWDKLPFHSLCKIDIEENHKDNKTEEIKALCDLLVPYLTRAEITKVDKYKKTLLHYAVSVLTKSHLKHLFNNGANEVTLAIDKYGKTALHQAAKWGNVEALKLILANGGKTLVNTTDNCNKTPLHEAAIHVRKEIIALLLAEGAEFETKSTSGQLTAIEESINKLGAEETFAIFSAYMKKTEDEKQIFLDQLLLKEKEQPLFLRQEFFSKRPLKRQRPIETEVADNSDNNFDLFLTSKKPKNSQPIKKGFVALKPEYQLIEEEPKPHQLQKVFGKPINFFTQKKALPIDYKCEYILKGHDSIIYCLAVFPDNRVITASLDKTLKVWDLSQPRGLECVQTLTGHSGQVLGVIVLSDNYVISASQDNTLKLWDLTKPKGLECIRTLVGHKNWVWCVTTLFENLIVSASEDGSIKVWNLAKLPGDECVRTLSEHDGGVLYVAVLSENIIASGSEDGAVKIWDLSKPQGLECIITLKGHNNWVWCVEKLSEHEIISASADGSLKIWDLKKSLDDMCVGTLLGHSDAIRSIAVSQNGLVVSASEDKSIRIWDLNKPQGFELVQIIQEQDKGILGIAISSDHRIISGAMDGLIKVWQNKIELTPEIKHVFSAQTENTLFLPQIDMSGNGAKFT